MASADANAETLRAFARAWDSENIQLLATAWRRGEVDLSPLLAEDVVYEDSEMPDHVGESYRGHAGFIQALETWSEPYEAMTLELQEIVGAGDRFVTIHRLHTKARRTAIEFDETGAYVWTFRDGRVVHVRGFRDAGEALRYADLSG
jgi:ketosteroid isomerase-like protein